MQMGYVMPTSSAFDNIRMTTAREPSASREIVCWPVSRVGFCRNFLTSSVFLASLSAVVLVGFLCAVPVQADIANLACRITQPADLSASFNAGQSISLSATWSGGTPPFSATFLANGGAIGTSNTTAGQAVFTIGAASLIEGATTFSVSVIETAVPGATAQSATADGQVTVDRIPPGIGVTLLSAAEVSPIPGFNEIRFRVTSTEPLAEAPSITISPSVGALPQADPVAAAPYTITTYKLQVAAGTLAGVYTITAIGKDNTLPAATCNQGAGRGSFQVVTGSGESPVINASTPPSPIRVTRVSLSGTVSAASSGGQKVEILNAGTVIGTANVAAGATSWQATVADLTEGSHSLTARRIDPLGNVSGESAPFPLVVDLTAPQAAVLRPAKTPVNTPRITITGNGATDPPFHSAPLKVTLERGGQVVATTTAQTDGSFAFNDVTLIDGHNLFTARVTDTTFDGNPVSGNQSAFSNFIEVILDRTPPIVIPGGVSISSPDTMVVSVDTSTEGSSDTSATPLPDGTSHADWGTRPLTKLLPATPVPVSGLFQGTGARMFLPHSLLHDRYSASIQATIHFRFVWDGANAFHALPMTRLEGGFNANLPYRGQVILYRYHLRDRAGNSSFCPGSGWLRYFAQRLEILRVVSHPTQFTADAVVQADEWPTAAFGMPSRSRLMAYRRLLVEASLLPQITALLQTSVSPPQVENLATARQPEPFSWKFDLLALQRGNLPPERQDLLLHDVVSGNIPDQLLPAPETLDAPRSLIDAIRFRLLHDHLR